MGVRRQASDRRRVRLRSRMTRIQRETKPTPHIAPYEVYALAAIAWHVRTRNQCGQRIGYSRLWGYKLAERLMNKELVAMSDYGVTPMLTTLGERSLAERKGDSK